MRIDIKNYAGVETFGEITTFCDAKPQKYPVNANVFVIEATLHLSEKLKNQQQYVLKKTEYYKRDP